MQEEINAEGGLSSSPFTTQTLERPPADDDGDDQGPPSTRRSMAVLPLVATAMVLMVVLGGSNSIEDMGARPARRAAPLHPLCSSAYLTLDSPASSVQESCLAPGGGSERWRHLDTPWAMARPSAIQGWTSATSSFRSCEDSAMNGSWVRFGGSWDAIPTVPQGGRTNRRTCGAASTAWVSGWDPTSSRIPPTTYRQPGTLPAQGPQFPADQTYVLCFEEGLRGRSLLRSSGSNGRACIVPGWDDRVSQAAAGGSEEQEEYQTCTNSVVATVINCGTFFLWRLPPTPRCEQAYCTERSRMFDDPSGGIPNHQRIGCYIDDNHPWDGRPRAISGPSVSLFPGTRGTSQSPAACADFCRDIAIQVPPYDEYNFCGVQGAYCFCGNEYDRYGEAPESECQLCEGDSSLRCGGGYRNSVYMVNNE